MYIMLTGNTSRRLYKSVFFSTRHFHCLFFFSTKYFYAVVFLLCNNKITKIEQFRGISKSSLQCVFACGWHFCRHTSWIIIQNIIVHSRMHHYMWFTRLLKVFDLEPISIALHRIYITFYKLSACSEHRIVIVDDDDDDTVA